MRNIGGNARGWQLIGVSPKALSLMPAEPLGEGGNSAVLSSMGQVATSKSDILEAEIFTSLLPSPIPLSTVGSGDSSDDLRSIVRSRSKSVPCMHRK